MCCPNTLQWRWRLCVCVRWMYGMVSCWPWTNSKYVVIGVWLNSKLLFVFDTVWDRNLTLMCGENALQWRWRLCIYVVWISGTASCWPWTNSKCVCIGVCLNLKLVFVFNWMSGRSIILMWGVNTLQWWWRLYVYVRWMYGMVSCWPWTNSQYVCVGVCRTYQLSRNCYSCLIQYEVVILRWCAV